MASVLAALFLLSSSSMAFEVLLTRYFSFTQWSHLSFMVISLALFGSAASGTVLSLLGRRAGAQDPGEQARTEGTLRATALNVLLFALAVYGSFLLVNALPFDYVRLPVDPSQAGMLLLVFLLLSLPFFVSGLAQAQAYARHSQRSGSIYLSSMAGSAAGALLPVLLLPAIGEARLVVLCGLPPLAALPFLARARARAAGLAIAAAILALALAPQARFLEPEASPFKTLRHLLLYPGAGVVQSTDSIRGRVDVVRSSGARYAPGLSLTYPAEVPAGLAVVVDGDRLTVLYDLVSGKAPDFCRYSLGYAGYLLGPVSPDSLVIHREGGLGAPSAVAAGARTVTVIEERPVVARLLAQSYGGAGVRVIVDNPRAYLRRSEERFDTIQVEQWGSSQPGMDSLQQDNLLTIDAFALFLQRLSPEGLLFFVRRDILPPTDLLRLFATARAALLRIGASDPGEHLAALRSWDSYILMVSRRPIPTDRLASLLRWADGMSFDPVFAAGLSEDRANGHVRQAQPFQYQAIQQLQRDPAFLSRYPFSVGPQSDDQPFPSHVIRWGRLSEIYRLAGGRIYALFLSGEFVVAIVLAAAVLLGLLLAFLPWIVAVAGGRGALRPRQRAGQRAARAASAAYFGCLGAGYMFVEMGLIYAGVLPLGDPVVSFTVVLALLLVASGLGGFLYERLHPRRVSAWVWLLPGVIAGVSLAIHPANRLALDLPLYARWLPLALVVLPCGTLMGVPFPAGMSSLPGAQERARGWALNGSLSVVAAVASVPLAFSLGIRWLIAAGALAYALAAICFTVSHRERGGEGAPDRAAGAPGGGSRQAPKILPRV